MTPAWIAGLVAVGWAGTVLGVIVACALVSHRAERQQRKDRDRRRW